MVRRQSHGLVVSFTAVGWAFSGVGVLLPDAAPRHVLWGFALFWLGWVAIQGLGTGSSGQHAGWRHASARWVLWIWILGIVGFQIGPAPFAAPRYLLPALAPCLLLLMGSCVRSRGWALATALSVALGLLVARAEFQFAEAQNLEALSVPVAVSKGVLGEMGLNASTRQPGWHRVIPVSKNSLPAWLLVPREVDHLAVPEVWRGMMDAVWTREILDPVPLRIMNASAHAGFYRHTRGVFPFSFSTQPVEVLTLYSLQRPGLKDWLAFGPPEILPAGPITVQNPLQQSLVCRLDGLSGLALNFATYARTNTCQVCVDISEPQGLVLWKVQLSAQEIQDNTWYRFAFPAIQDAAGRPFVVTLSSPDGTLENAVTLWANRCADGHYRRGKETCPGRLGIQFLCRP